MTMKNDPVITYNHMDEDETIHANIRNKQFEINQPVHWAIDAAVLTFLMTAMLYLFFS